MRSRLELSPYQMLYILIGQRSVNTQNIQTKKFVDGYQLENTEDQQDYKKQMKQINDLIERRYRQGKRTTLLIAE